MVIRVCARPWWSWPGEWSVSNLTTNRSSNGEPSWLKVPWLVALRAKKPSSPWPGNWRLICGDFAPAAAHGLNHLGNEFEGNRKEGEPYRHKNLTTKILWNVGAASYLTWSDYCQCGSHRRLRLGAPKFLFH